MAQLSNPKFKKSPSFSFRGKFTNSTSCNDSSNIPSPNLYKPQKMQKNGPRVKFSMSQRKSVFDRKAQRTPGPGQYQTSRSVDFNTYSVKSQGKIKTFCTKFYQRTEQKPGPGAYDVSNVNRKLPMFSMGVKIKTSQQIQFENNKFKPSPGSYEIQAFLPRSRSMISIPKSPKMKSKQSQVPGPGKYQINQKLFFSQKSFGKKTFSSTKKQISFQAKNQSPGPGKYAFESIFQRNKRKSNGFSCRKTTNEMFKSETLPGPGQYSCPFNLKFRSASVFRISLAKRKSYFQRQESQSPGPQKYENLNESYSKCKFKSLSAPRFSKAKLETVSTIKLEKSDKCYNPKVNFIKKSSSSFSIGLQKKKSMFQKIFNLPGPGDYNPELNLLKQKVLVAKFSTSTRPNVILNKLKPGPGQYNIEQRQSSLGRTAAKFTKSKRLLNFINAQSQKRSVSRIYNSLISPMNSTPRYPITKAI